MKNRKAEAEPTHQSKLKWNWRFIKTVITKLRRCSWFNQLILNRKKLVLIVNFWFRVASKCAINWEISDAWVSLKEIKNELTV